MNFKIKKVISILPYSFGHLLSCVFLCVNAVQSHYLARDLNLSLVQSSWLTSIYIFGFFIGLFPMGILLDSFPTKYVFSSFFTIAALGLFIFSFFLNFHLLLFARFIIGFGASSALMSALKINAGIFQERLATINGLTMFMGGIGTFIAGKPLQLFLDYGNWHLCNIVLGILTLIVIWTTFSFGAIGNIPLNRNQKTLLKQLSEIKFILKNIDFVYLCFLTVVPFGLFIAMFTFWSSQWLIHADHFSISSSAICMSLMAIAVFLAPLLLGIIADFYNSKGIKIEIIILWGIIIYFAFQVLILSNVISGVGDYILWFFFAFFAQAGNLAFVQVVDIFKEEYIGRAITILNIFMFLIAFIIQTSFGYIIKIFHYFATPISISYSYSFFIFFVIEVILCLLFIFRKKSVIV